MGTEGGEATEEGAGCRRAEATVAMAVGATVEEEKAVVVGAAPAAMETAVETVSAGGVGFRPAVETAAGEAREGAGSLRRGTG